MTEETELIPEEKVELSADEELIRVFHHVDDGCDWSAWHIWYMGNRRRISERRFELPPARPQIMPSSIKPKRRKKRRKIVEVP